MLAEWGEWYYLIYLLPFGLALVLLIASAAMGGGGDDGGADGEGGMDADAGDMGAAFADAGADAPDADFHAGGDLGDAGDGGGDSHGLHGSPGGGTLEFLGFGRAPLTLLLQGFMLSWGAVGAYSTYAFSQQPSTRPYFILAGLASALLAGISGMKFLGALGSRYMKSVETYAIHGDSLVGEIGVVTYPISETMGRAHVYDQHGTLHVESCRVEPGRPTIARNEKVLLVKYDPQRRQYWVEPSPV